MENTRPVRMTSDITEQQVTALSVATVRGGGFHDSQEWK
jgi:hypothetical protein